MTYDSVFYEFLEDLVHDNCHAIIKHFFRFNGNIMMISEAPNSLIGKTTTTESVAEII